MAIPEETLNRIRNNDPQLTTLYLSNKNLNSNDINILTDVFNKNKSLIYLDLSINNIGDDGAKALAEAFKENKSLTDLDLSINNIGDDGAKALAEAFKENKSLTDLDLSINNIGDDGAKALAEAFKENKSLINLDLSVNNIGDDGAKALAEAFKENKSLTNLDLSVNNIGDDGAKALAEAFKENKSLINLDLSENNIGDDGAKALAEAFKENKSLINLDLSENNIGDDGAKALAEAFKENKSLTNLDLSVNNIGDDALRTLEKSIIDSGNKNIISFEVSGNVSDDFEKYIKKNRTTAYELYCDIKDGKDFSEEEIQKIKDRIPAIKDYIKNFSYFDQNKAEENLLKLQVKYPELAESLAKYLPAPLSEAGKDTATPAKSEELGRIFKAMDRNGNQNVEDEEFAQYVKENPDKLKEIVEALDGDKDGKISQKELEEIGVGKAIEGGLSRNRETSEAATNLGNMLAKAGVDLNDIRSLGIRGNGEEYTSAGSGLNVKVNGFTAQSPRI